MHCTGDGERNQVATGAGKPFGLSTAHISPPGVSVSVGGSLVKLSAGSLSSSVQSGGGLRSAIEGFSRQSRLRLMRALAAVDKRALVLPLFVTLTYPAEWEQFGPADVKRHLDNFLKALRRKHPTAAGFWRLEFQARGAPHFHLLLFNVEWLDWKWVAATWARVVASGDEKHEQAGTEVRRCLSWRSAASYVAKYMAKTDGPAAPWENPGRFWGIFGREHLPLEQLDVVLDLPQFYRFRRIMLRWMKSRGYHLLLHRYQGISAFLDWLTAMRVIECVT